jgi:hypothetical protein
MRRTFVLACVLLTCASACWTERKGDHGPLEPSVEDAGRLDVKRKFDSQSGKLIHEWTVLVRRTTAPVRHGRDQTWYASGAKEWEREYDHGKPMGVWRRWYENGHQQSETFFGSPQIETTMRFWHENGQLSAQGPGRNGERYGVWRIYHQDGRLAEEGPYVNSEREGAWTVWSDDGATSRTVKYSKNVRVGEIPNPPGAVPQKDPASKDAPPKQPTDAAPKAPNDVPPKG